jgi:hypothetical protein
MSDDYLYDKSGADPEIAKLEDALGAYAHRAPLRPGRPKRRVPMLIAGAVFAAAAAAVVVVQVRAQVRANGGGCGAGAGGFAFSVEGGAARCAGGLADRGKLPVGAWLETPHGAVADVRVADIGAVRLYGDSRLRLVGTGPNEHRLELAEGRLSAKVTAPPRLFVVDTPAAAAVDQGCAYELSVDASGRTTLKVTTGAVTLVARSRSWHAGVVGGRRGPAPRRRPLRRRRSVGGPGDREAGRGGRHDHALEPARRQRRARARRGLRAPRRAGGPPRLGVGRRGPGREQRGAGALARRAGRRLAGIRRGDAGSDGAGPGR